MIVYETIGAVFSLYDVLVGLFGRCVWIAYRA